MKKPTNSNSKNNNNKFNKSLHNLNNLDLSQTVSSHRKNKNLDVQKYQINCNINSKQYKSSVNKINSINSENEEELNVIQNLWDDLGVSQEYQEEFVKFIISLNDDEQYKNDIFYYEKNNLRKFREALIKLSIEISNRIK